MGPLHPTQGSTPASIIPAVDRQPGCSIVCRKIHRIPGDPVLMLMKGRHHTPQSQRMMTRFRCRAALSAHIAAAALGGLLIASAFDAPAGAQSFDCRNARSADEKAICQNTRLGELDKQLADVYDRAGGKLSKQERTEFENHETAFVNARRRCGDHAACIEQSYRNRLQELLSALPEDQSGRAERRGDTKRSDRPKASRDSGKTEEAQTPTDATRAPSGEAAVQAPERSPVEDNRKSGAPSPSPAETRSRPSEPAPATAAVPNPPSRREAEAALSGSPPAEKHSRRKSRTESVAVTPAAPQREEPPAASAPPAPEKHAPPEKHPSKSAAAPASERHPATSTSAAGPEQHPAAGSSTAAAEPPNPPEKRHSRAKHVAVDKPVPPSAVDQATPASKPEIKWVNPAPSP